MYVALGVDKLRSRFSFARKRERGSSCQAENFDLILPLDFAMRGREGPSVRGCSYGRMSTASDSDVECSGEEEEGYIQYLWAGERRRFRTESSFHFFLVRQQQKGGMEEGGPLRTVLAGGRERGDCWRRRERGVPVKERQWHRRREGGRGEKIDRRRKGEDHPLVFLILNAAPGGKMLSYPVRGHCRAPKKKSYAIKNF